MNLDDFSYIDNDRRYVNPQVSLNEQNAFIDNLRNTQGQDTAQIRQDTYNLGTAVPSNLGGLAGGSNYFKSRYQTPQTNSMVSDLRAAAQSQALSTLLNNEIGKAKKRYSDAYRAAKKRANNISSGNNPNNYLDKLAVKAEDDGSGPKQPVAESPLGSNIDIQIEAINNELRPLRNLYNKTETKYPGNFWGFVTSPTPDYISNRQAQDERLKRIKELEAALATLEAKRGKNG